MSSETVGARVWGLAAEFERPADLLHAAERVREAGYTRWDVHTPFPVHGLNEAMGLRLSRLPWFSMACGIVGGLTGFWLQWWTNALDYPVVTSGKPLWAVPANVPVAFELTILFSAVGTFVGMLVANGLPYLYHPTFRSPRLRRGTNDRFFVIIESSDPLFDARGTRELLEALQPRQVEELEDEP
ncbi:MAG: DUF3341 domain-containing protein [Acidobacteria bacterium]|nr:DUF3341 domain-containing protein [Acidobacteriota bacterium]